ncbi:MAG: hypothetical protein M3494_01090 [Actinomycetota bacterium]|jgi:hypothetical protein|nr:hypothetical protein [Rubrobacter sp.]MDQ3506604.1 hypothetical protein [Actinomycetota bacterium]
MDIATIAQIASAAGTLAYLVVFGILYYLLVRLYREMLDETRAGRRAQERPQILVEADYSRLPSVDLVIRSIGHGAAKNISFEFSSEVEDSEGFALTELPYFKRGLGFLAPDSEVRIYWDTLDNVIKMLKEKGFEDGVTVTAHYNDLDGRPFADRWTFDPLLYEESHNTRQANMSDLVKAVRNVSDKLDERNERR